MKIRCWLVGFAVMIGAAVSATRAHAWFWHNYGSFRYSAHLLVRPYNAFTPVCSGTIMCDGCVPLQNCGMGNCCPTWNPCYTTPCFQGCCPPACADASYYNPGAVTYPTTLPAPAPTQTVQYPAPMMPVPVQPVSYYPSYYPGYYPMYAPMMPWQMPYGYGYGR